MGFFSFLDPAMDFIFGWLLNMSYFWSIFILSFFLALLISLIYKYTTNQSLMKDLKTEIKELQKEMKELRHDPQRMMAVQKKAMETNMKYMMHSMKPMIFTFIPIIIIFGWMSAHFAYYPILPGQNFTTEVITGGINGTIRLVAPEGVEILGGDTKTIANNSAKWKLNAGEGEYILEYWYDDSSYAQNVIITNDKFYANPVKKIGRKDVKSILASNQPVKILDLHFRGWKLGWVGTYIVFSLIFSLLVRKLLKIY